jgi:hypothetical protein
MTETEPTKAPRDRSPSFPVISLKSAIERLERFEATFGRHPAPYQKVGLAWGIKQGSSQANQVLAALKSFGLLDYKGAGDSRTVEISDDGRTFLRAQQVHIKRDIIRNAALKPKAFAKFWPEWGVDRPIDAICLDQLVLQHGFNDAAAPTFLRVYDETMAYAGLTDSDKGPPAKEAEEELSGGSDAKAEKAKPPEAPASPTTPSTANAPPSGAKKVVMMENERVLTSGILSKMANFRVLVEGPISAKEIDRLIAKLELDKEILADTSEEETVQ